MDARDDREAQQGMSEEGPQQRASREGPASPGERGGDHTCAVLGAIHGHCDPVRRRHDPEIVGHVHVEERRHVEVLVTALMDRSPRVRIDRDHVDVPLPERVGDLVEDRRRRAVAVVTEVDAEGIERVSEQARQRQQADRATVRHETGGDQMPLDHRAQRQPRRGILRQVVAIVEGEQIEAVAGEQFHVAVERLQLVEIEQSHEHAIAQMVRLRPEAAMHDDAVIEAGR